MNAKRLFYSGTLALLTFSTLFGGTNIRAEMNENSDIFLPTSGTVNVTITKLDQKTETEANETKTNGIDVIANVKVKGEEISGNIVIPSIQERYNLVGTKVADQPEFDLYEGKVENHEHHYFESFVIEDNNSVKAIVNIFEKDDEGNRIDPFTIHLDNSKSERMTKNIRSEVLKSNRKEQVKLEDSIGITEVEYETLGKMYANGIVAEVQGWKGRDSETPWIMRSWTVTDEAIEESMKPGAVRGVWVIRAELDANSPKESYFDAETPSSDDQVNFVIPWIYQGNFFEIPVNVSSTSVDTSFTTDFDVLYLWNLKDSEDFEEGKNEEGILAEAEFNWRSDVTRNEWGYIEIESSHTITYELVGDYREYYEAEADWSIWYE